jgi:hypothetical protein
VAFQNPPCFRPSQALGFPPIFLDDIARSANEWKWNGPSAIIAAEGDAAMSDVDQKRTTGGQTDVAALGSGVVGVAVAILIQPGAFKPAIARACSISISIIATTPGNRRDATARLSVRSERQISTRFNSG